MDYSRIPHEKVAEYYYTNLPRQLYDDLEDNKITHNMFCCLAWLYRWADWRTGIAQRVCAGRIAADMWPSEVTRPEPETVQEAIRLLGKCGYIRSHYRQGSRRNYPVTIMNFVVEWQGEKIRLNPSPTAGWEEVKKASQGERASDRRSERAGEHPCSSLDSLDTLDSPNSNQGSGCPDVRNARSSAGGGELPGGKDTRHGSGASAGAVSQDSVPAGLPARAAGGDGVAAPAAGARSEPPPLRPAHPPSAGNPSQRPSPEAETLRDRWLELQVSVWGFEPELGDRDAAPMDALLKAHGADAIGQGLDWLPKSDYWNRQPRGRIHGTQGLASAFPAILRQCRKYAELRAATLERIREEREESRKEMEELEARRLRHRQELARAKAEGRSMYGFDKGPDAIGLGPDGGGFSFEDEPAVNSKDEFTDGEGFSFEDEP